MLNPRPNPPAAAPLIRSLILYISRYSPETIRRLRIRIEPEEESLREGCPMFSVVSAPLWSISKPERCIEAVQKKVERLWSISKPERCIEAVQKKVERLGGDSPREQVEGARAANRTESKL